MEAGAFTAQGGIGNLPQQPRPEAHRLEREYIWGPGDSFAGVDELFVLFDREREPWLVLQDASGDVAALCGRTSNSQPAYVAAQWTWDAYGNVFSADHLFDHPFLSIGHKGLFVERLDVGVADASVPGAQYADTPRLTPFAHHIYHNRNRSYHPTLGRFLQADPNASGTRLHERVMFSGQRPLAYGPTLDLSERFADGANLYQYVRSSPWNLSDPLGLFSGEDAFTNSTEALGLLDPLPGPGDFIRSVLKELVSEYAANMSWDAEWASDWSTGDDWHSRGDSLWVTLAIGRGLYNAFDIDLPFTERSFNPLDLVADSKATTKGPRVARTPMGKARYSRTVTVDGYTASIYSNPTGNPRELVRFDKDSIKAVRNVTPSNRDQERMDANMMYWGKPYNPPGFVWHHHWTTGVMQLVPEPLHRSIAHIGRAQFWPPEVQRAQ